MLPNRLAVFVAMWLSMVVLAPDAPPSGVTLGDRPNAKNLLVDGWLRWDAHWYWQLAGRGFTNQAQNGGQRDTAFFPAYPLLVRVVSLLTRDRYWAGMLVSNACMLGAAYVLFRVAEQRRGEEVARRAVLLMLVYPWSYVLSAMYTESLFLASALLAFYLAERELWWAAGLAAAVTGATRVLGFSVVPALALLYLERRRWRVKDIRPNALGLGLGALGPAAHMLFLKLRFGDALLFLRSQDVAGWGGDSHLRDLLPAAKSLLDLRKLMDGTAAVPAGIHVLALAGGAVACVACMVYFRVAYGAWGLAYLLLSMHKWDGMGRFVVVVFPLYLVGAVWLRRPAALRFVVATGYMLMSLLMLLFSHWRYLATP